MAFYGDPYASVGGLGYGNPAFGSQLGSFGVTPMPGAAPSAAMYNPAMGVPSSFGRGGVAVTPTPGAIASFPSSRSVRVSEAPRRGGSSVAGRPPVRAHARVARYNSEPGARVKVSCPPRCADATLIHATRRACVYGGCRVARLTSPRRCNSWKRL